MKFSLKIRPSKTRFLAELSVDWEKSAYQFSEIAERGLLKNSNGFGKKAEVLFH